MPPRPGRGGHAGGTPAPAPNPTPRAQRSGGPSRFSTSYGSPSMYAAARSSTSSSLDGIGSAVRSVRDSNAADGQNGANQRASRADNQGARPSNNGGLAAPPPAPPVVPPPANQQPSGPANNNQRTPPGVRASTVQPPRQSGGNNTRSSRFMSVPLYSDTPSHRSFIEENELYHGANVGTPGTPRPPRSTSDRRGTQTSPSESDIIDDDDDEDPLQHDTPGGSRRHEDLDSTPRPPPSYRPISWADRFTRDGGFRGNAGNRPPNNTGTPTRHDTGISGTGAPITPGADTGRKGVSEHRKDLRDLEGPRVRRGHKGSPDSPDHKVNQVSLDYPDCKDSRDHKDNPGSLGHKDHRGHKDHKDLRDHKDYRGRKGRGDREGREGQ
ncbi:hypothetical protein LA080_010855 [Diaporthe eres]|nr:hypothetical protein LA080_010855 [Diaporthe eres]